MIDEKKLIEDLLHNDGIGFEVTLENTTPQELVNAFQEFANKMKEGFVELIKAQPKYEWINVFDRLPEEQRHYFCFCENSFHVQKLLYIPNRGFYSGLVDLKKRNDVYCWADIKPSAEDDPE